MSVNVCLLALCALGAGIVCFSASASGCGVRGAFAASFLCCGGGVYVCVTGVCAPRVGVLGRGSWVSGTAGFGWGDLGKLTR